MLIAFNKPFNVLCQFTDRSEPARRTLAEFGLPANVYAAGRLDYDSEGLLLLTDDGGLAHQLTDPRHKQPCRRRQGCWNPRHRCGRVILPCASARRCPMRGSSW